MYMANNVITFDVDDVNFLFIVLLVRYQEPCPSQYMRVPSICTLDEFNTFNVSAAVLPILLCNGSVMQFVTL